jgi:hypothetical protein
MPLKNSGTLRAFCGQKARCPKIEEKLFKYMSGKRQIGYAVSTEMCHLKALALAKKGNRWFQGKPRMDYDVSYKKQTLYKKKN